MRAASVVTALSGLVSFLVLLVGCGRGTGGDPFASEPRAGTGGEGGVVGAGGEDAGPPPLDGGESCVDDLQCDDGIDCTRDACDLQAGSCVHEPDPAPCDNGIYCDGYETCSATLGCQRGPVIGCSDEYACTIDTCIEETQSCRHELRDADGDGDPPSSCTGTDCNDFDPLVSGTASERCGNQRDDDCDGEVDEDDCVMPLYDRCGDALELDAAGTYALSTRGAAKDYAISCEKQGDDSAFRELVVAVTVPSDGPRDVDLVATLARVSARLKDGELVLASTDRCGKADGETACVAGSTTAGGDAIARLVLRNAAPGAHAVYVAADVESEVLLHVDFRTPEPVPTNETCGTSELLEPGVPVRQVLAELAPDLETACPEKTGELVYRFSLSEPSDVRVQSVALDDYGDVVVSLRDAECNADDSEISCRSAPQSELFARALPAGTYAVALSGTGPTEAELVLAVSPATQAPPSEGCSDPPPIEPGVTEQVALSDATDAVQMGCLIGAPDATFALALAERSDVLLVQTGSKDDVGGVLVATGACESIADRAACSSTAQWPGRTVAHGVGPGRVFTVVETAAGKPTTLTALTRPAVSSVFVQSADECDDAFEIPAAGGRFEGNTANQYAQYDASCDYGGQEPGGAPEQLLKLVLTERRRVVLDASASSYHTLLVVRDAESCPGDEVAGTCSLTYTVPASDEAKFAFVDTVLEAGSYFVQIDGYNGDKGRWVLEVFTSTVTEQL